MIHVIVVSGTSEVPIAHELAALVRAAWPDVAASASDRVTIAVGVTFSSEIDLLVAIELATPRAIPARERRDGTRSPVDADVQSALIAIEVKQLDPSRFEIVGTDLVPRYGRGTNKRSVAAQLSDVSVAVRGQIERYGVESFFAFAVGWMTEMAPADLSGVVPWIVGADADWFAILDAAAQRSASLYGAKSKAHADAIATIRTIATRTRPLSPLDREKANALATDTIVADVIDDLARDVGHKQVCVAGRGGSGKTTTLALLAKRLAETRGERVLFLTFHRTLRGDIAHLVDALVDEPGARARIRVDTVTNYLIDVLSELGIAIPKTAEAIDYGALREATASLARAWVADPEKLDVALLREVSPGRFAFDAVLIDEAQDWHDEERDLVRMLFGRSNVVLADGIEQLVRRQTSCDWNVGVPKVERSRRELGRSLRMQKNLALFANAFARASGLVDWKIAPFDRLTGGRIVVVVGPQTDVTPTFAAVRTLLASGGARPVDALVCVPPTFVSSSSPGRRESIVARELRDVGETVWDASDAALRDTPPESVDAWRIVQYDSCRGLEGWVVLAYGLDRLVANKRKYPNFVDGETGDPEAVARRWLMIALTRAVHTLVVTIEDPGDPLVATIREAAAHLPNGVVEFADGATLPSVLVPGLEARNR